MSTPDDRPPNPEPGLDELVRAQLDAEAARVDAHALCAGVLARLDAPAPPPPRRRRRVAAGVAWLALAASVFVAVLALTGPREALATPAQVVAAARELSADGADRCYRMTIDVPPSMKQVLPLVAAQLHPRAVCTRGRRFVVEPGLGGTGAWGRDGAGRVWAAPSRDAAARYDEEELPPPLRYVVRVIGLELPHLLDEVLADCDLAWTEPPAADAWTVTAARRTPARLFQVLAGTLVVEKRTRAVRSLTLTRKLLGDDVARLRLELQATRARPDAAYEAEGHVAAGAPVYDRASPGLRRRLLVRHLGRVLASGL
jgi:hypothetical protein